MLRSRLLAIAVVSVIACSKGGTAPAATSGGTGTPEGAKALLSEFLKPGADVKGLSAKLQPTTADYAAVYNSAAAAKLEKALEPAWTGGQAVLAPKPGQTELLLASATVDQLKAGTDQNCPGGYKKAAASMNPGVTIYCFKFVEPGKTLGMAFDGLSFVNNHWVLIPKPWRALE